MIYKKIFGNNFEIFLSLDMLKLFLQLLVNIFFLINIGAYELRV